MYSFSQTVTGNIEKAATHPKRAENAAKADVYVADRKIVSNDTKPRKKQALAISKKQKEKARKRRFNKS